MKIQACHQITLQLFKKLSIDKDISNHEYAPKKEDKKWASYGFFLRNVLTSIRVNFEKRYSIQVSYEDNEENSTNGHQQKSQEEQWSRDPEQRTK